MSRLSALTRRPSKSSVLSDATYHSFHDIELFEPAMSSSTSATSASSPTRSTRPGGDEFEPTEMRRQDSGYESIPPHNAKRRTSTTSSNNSGGGGGGGGGGPRPRTRPSARRSPKSGPVAHLPRTGAHQLYITRSNPPQQQQAFTYFHFPAPPEPLDEQLQHQQQQQQQPRPSLGANPFQSPRSGGHSFDFSRQQQQQQNSPPLRSETPTFPVPPQTTHYWTSDRTRRLEYAAIDAASRGVRGWVMRHIVPECFIPRERRHIGFEDDSGSVRRYRLDLDEDDAGGPAEKERRGGRWRLWRRKTA